MSTFILIIMAKLIKTLGIANFRNQKLHKNLSTFATQKAESIQASLDSYVNQLKTFNKKMRLPTQQQIIRQNRIIQTLVTNKELLKISALLQRIKHQKFRTIDKNSLPRIENLFINNFKEKSSQVSSSFYVKMSYFLAINQCFDLLDICFQNFQNNIYIQEASIPKLEFQQKLIVFLIGQTIKQKSKVALNSFFSQKLLQTLKNEIITNRYIQEAKVLKNLYHQEVKQASSCQYLPSLNYHQRSILQKEAECLLKALNKNFQRQILFKYKDNTQFKVDFLINQPQKKQRKTVLQIMGNHHYTPDNKLKGFDILRALLINQSLPIRFAHQANFNSAKGIRNKMIYLDQVISLKKINWEPQGKETPNKWILDI